ncbi:MAG: hypothetical protein EPO39_06185, partial [Candidatus Manganitrophaceae bacterium]
MIIAVGGGAGRPQQAEKPFLRVEVMKAISGYSSGLQSGPIVTIVLLVLLFFSPKILQKHEPSDEGRDFQISAGMTTPDTVPQTEIREKEPAARPPSSKFYDRVPDRVSVDCSESQSGLSEPDRSGQIPAANSDVSSPERIESLPLPPSIETEDEMSERHLS